MRDGFGRQIDYLRISLTDKCNLRCSYCMPKDGVNMIPHERILSLEETARIASVMRDLGIRKIRLTGGEPLVRKNLSVLLRELDKIGFPDGVHITTNGTLLKDHLDELVEAHIAGINISLDTLRPETFRKLTGEDMLKGVLEAAYEAYDKGIRIKINCVPIRGINDDELINIAYLAKDRRIDVRFIELMPIGCGRDFELIPSGEIKKILESTLGTLTACNDEGRSQPAKMYDISGFSGRIGFISPMSQPFCSSCNRIRLTAEGFLKLCLEKPDGIDLRTPLRENADDAKLADLIVSAVRRKAASHDFRASGASEHKKMVQIGG